MSPFTAEDSTAEGRPATGNALAITAIVAVVLNLAAMLRRPTVLPRRGSHLCACRGVRACLRVARRRVLLVMRDEMW